MIRGTTPTHIFDIPFDVSLIADLRVSYSQDGTQIICKKLEDCQLVDKTITLKLTQEETLKICTTSPVLIQLKIKTLGGEVVSHHPIAKDPCDCLNSEVM